MVGFQKRSVTGSPCTMLTCYDYPTARALDTSSIDGVLIGDSLGTNVLGYRSVLEVTLSDIIHHLKAVRRGFNSDKTIVADLPYNTYRTAEEAIANARELTGRGADMVKVEGGAEIAPILAAMVDAGIPVMGHVGFQPQVLHGNKHSVIGDLARDAKRVFDDTVALAEAGAQAVVVECVPELVCKEITEHVAIPTIGIGSGQYCDGQILVITDVLGWYDLPYRFIRRFARFADQCTAAANALVDEVRSGSYPARNHGFRIRREELEAFRTELP